MGLFDGVRAEILWALEGFFLVRGADVLVGALVWVNLIVWRRILRGRRPPMVTARLVRPTSLDLRGGLVNDTEMRRSPPELEAAISFYGPRPWRAILHTSAGRPEVCQAHSVAVVPG